MDDKITIIEGPPPTFELIPGGLVTGVIDSPNPANVAVTRLRTFNGNELVERCHRAWRNRQPINLEFRTPDGLKKEVPIVAARATEDELERHLLLLWVRLTDDDMEVEYTFGYFDDEDEDGDEPNEDLDDDFGPWDLNL